MPEHRLPWNAQSRPDFRSTEAPQSVSHQMKPDRLPLRLSDERPRSHVLPTNAMIPPPHGFARTEDSIGNEKNITFWVEIVLFVTLAALMSALGQKQTCAAKEHIRFTPE